MLKFKIITAVCALWLGLAGAGVWSMARYASEPGAEASAPQSFPSAAEFALDSTRTTLVMLAHPQCPCTRASIKELSVLMANYPDRVRAYVLFYAPSSKAENWARTSLWESAAQIPGVTVLSDRDAAATQLFGAYTSGQTLLYDTSGKLVFKGGITAGRGHEGANSGRAAIEKYLASGDNSAKTSFVFGCAITSDSFSSDQVQ